MKINIIICKNPFFESSASANRWRTLIDGLAQLGADIKILITGGYISTAEFKKLRKEGTYNGIDYKYLNFVFNHKLWLRRINLYILKPLFHILTQNKVVKIAKQEPEAVYWTGSDFDSFRIAVRLKELNQGLKTFLEMSEYMDIHNYNKGRFVHKTEGKKRQIFFEKKAFHAYDGIALMTKTLLNYYRNFPQPRPMLLHLPMTVDLERFNKILPLPDGFKRPYIAFVGVMNNAKEGVDILIKAFSKISDIFKEYNLYLIGPWHYDTPGHKKLIRELRLEDRVNWMGEYNRDEIPAILKNTDLLVLPRPDSKQAKGGFPTKLGEYLASGVPVCATMVGEIPDYLTDNESVFFAEPGSVESFTRAMERALGNPEKAREIGINGRKVAEKYFNKDIQSKLLLDFLYQLT